MSAPRVRLTFPAELVREPILGRMVQKFGVVPNIRRADVSEEVGWIVCELDGEGGAVSAALEWLGQIGVDVDRLDRPLEG